MKQVRWVLWGLVVAAAIGAAALHFARETPRADQAVSPDAPVAVGGPFTLTRHTGQTISSSSFDGLYRLIYFGFTYCPDVCPTELARMATVLERLGDKADRIQPLFVTVDPERDTPEVLSAYVRHFHPRLIGLTGSPEEIALVLRDFRVYAKKSEQPGSAVGYLMDHSSVLYLMGPEGEFITFFTADDSAETIIAKLAALP